MPVLASTTAAGVAIAEVEGNTSLLCTPDDADVPDEDDDEDDDDDAAAAAADDDDDDEDDEDDDAVVLPLDCAADWFLSSLKP